MRVPWTCSPSNSTSGLIRPLAREDYGRVTLVEVISEKDKESDLVSQMRAAQPVRGARR